MTSSSGSHWPRSFRTRRSSAEKSRGSRGLATPYREEGLTHAKAAIVVLAGIDSHADLGRVTNALMTVQEFAEAGDESTLIFDGAGVLWAAELLKDDHRLHGAFGKVRAQVLGACHFCAGAFGVRDELEQQQFPPLRDHKGHLSLRALVTDGYEVITF